MTAAEGCRQGFEDWVLSLQPSQVPSPTCGSQGQPQFTGVHGPRGIFIELVERGLEGGEAGGSHCHKAKPQSDALAP